MAEDVGSLTVAILREIRDAVRETNTRVDSLRSELSARIGATNERLDRLEHHQIETDVRLSTELVALHEAVLDLARAVRADRDVRVRVEQHDARIGALERKVG